ncbi:chromate efflux transporter [Oscillatoria sp. FACHB-1406]|uniref:chromate efflux transporter n=1 Tax=Oscillatoria sp. FACHB-1406 TaxID=2692846 RepID=UPI0016846A61|nr:chromate efflux transporter [Oscillatoria sp. FACHB-1406]MBD2578393.1 chromate efflux transporter [Oscillatoria sp. FACHB-1406]
MNSRPIELAKVFLKLGTIGFGGPAAHIAMMEEEVVTRRQWLTRSHFLDLLGATNLIPGPNSTEMAIHIGYSYGGLSGLAIAGICFIFPAVLITAFCAWLYVKSGTLFSAEFFLYGIKPAVLAIILNALWRLGKKAVKNRQLAIIALGVVPLLLLGMNEAIALLLGGIIGAVWLKSTLPPDKTAALLVAGLNGSAIARTTAVYAAQTVDRVAPSLWQIGLFFLKVGSVLFGSGYVLIAFLQGEVVDKYGWLTQQELLDAIAIGQFTPGPVLSTATFIGYLIAGIPGAIVATIGIFFPSFLFVALLNPLIPKLRTSQWTAAFLDAVNVSAVALMAVVTVQLAIAILLKPFASLPFDPLALLILVLAAIAAFRFQLNAAWIVLGGGILGSIAFGLLTPESLKPLKEAIALLHPIQPMAIETCLNVTVAIS